MNEHDEDNREPDYEVDLSQSVAGYESLARVLHEAYSQAAVGKGAERHAGGQPFDRQPMQKISELLGTPRGMAFQAIKKLHEALDMPETDRKVHELLGAINYIAGIVIYLRNAPQIPTDREKVVARLAEFTK